ncbi:MAG: sensor domain-containing diguanylate cyclase [Actinobacteria bacterium]|jgi:diguanylate cyclase (GGDEF)-like protein/PAS domain S-box-containing protein|nr:sensor domain-containing diguanylate cyclase [Actinomycetota bacterium]
METWLGSKAAAGIGSSILLALIAVLCIEMQSSFTSGVPLLFLLPILWMAVSFKLLGGVVGGLISSGLLLISLSFQQAGWKWLAVVIGVFLFIVVGCAVGYLADRESPDPIGSDSKWFEMSNDMLVEASLDGYFLRLSPRWETVLGWTREELMSRPFKEFIHPDDLEATSIRADTLDLGPAELINFENRYRAKDGTYRWLLWSAKSDNKRKYAIARDITDRKLLEAEREELLAKVSEIARTDFLTGLPNRRAWDEELRKEAARSLRSGRNLALAIIDLDNFKDYNDTFGHGIGDELLIKAASAWGSALRETDFLARYGGEEFAILMPDCSPEEVVTVVDRLRLATPDNQTCSAGIALWDFQAGPEEFMSRADHALYEAKHLGRNRIEVAR